MPVNAIGSAAVTRPSAPAFFSPNAKSYPLSLPSKHVTLDALKLAATKGKISTTQNLVDGDFSLGAPKKTSVSAIEAVLFADTCTTMSEAEANKVIGYLQAAVKSGAALTRADWGDVNAEWTGMMIGIQRPGSTSATMLNLITDQNLGPR